MTFFYQIENDNINKIYGDGPYPSGASIIPYTWGWSNKYAPRPYGLKVRSSYYSNWAQSYISNSSDRENGGSSRYGNYHSAGPVNAIYEVEISGITTTSGGCVGAESLNKTYYVYLYPDITLGSYLNNIAGNIDDGENIWYGKACSLTEPINLCNINTLSLTLGAYRYSLLNNDNLPGLSGNVELILRLYYNGHTLINQYSTMGELRFKKSYGYMQQTESQYNTLKPNMMEGDIVLQPDTVGTEFLSASPPINIGSQFFGSTVTSGDFGVNLTNAIAIIRPYKTSFFDVKNSNINFSDNDDFPLHHTNVDGFSTNLGRGYWNANNLTNQNIYAAKNLLQSTLGDTTFGKLIGTDLSIASGLYHHIPQTFRLSFSNVTNSGTRGNCVPCNQFYSAFKNLNIYNIDNGLLMYNWVGATQIDSSFTNKYSSPFRDLNYYNICSNGCNNRLLYNIGATTFATRNVYGICNNILQFSIEASDSGTNAYVHFLSSPYSGAVVQTYVSSKRFKKVLCEQNGATPCWDYVATPYSSGKYGLIDFWSNDTWVSGWTLETFNKQTLFPAFNYTPPEMDVLQYCDFSNADVILTPHTNPGLPCAFTNCTICGDYEVPQTATIDSYSLSLSSNSQEIYGGKGGCRWEYRGLDNSGIILTYRTLSQGYNIFEVTSDYPTLVGAYSGLTTGKAVDFKIDCNNPISCQAKGKSITFSDFYDIRDYL
jgi:hypothetical protein